MWYDALGKSGYKLGSKSGYKLGIDYMFSV